MASTCFVRAGRSFVKIWWACVLKALPGRKGSKPRSADDDMNLSRRKIVCRAVLRRRHSAARKTAVFGLRLRQFSGVYA